MPILVSCTCGKSYQANDNMAGKQLRCPACSSTLTVPFAAATADPFGFGGGGGGQNPFSGGAASSGYGMPSGNASYGAPSYGAPSYGTPNYGTPSYGAPSYGGASSGSRKGVPKGLIIGIVCAVGGLGLLGVIGVVVALVMPAIQSARARAAQNGQAGGATMTSASPAGGWIVHAPSGSGFSVEMPSIPKRTSKNNPTPTGIITANVDQCLLSNDRGVIQTVFAVVPLSDAEAAVLTGQVAEQALDLEAQNMVNALPGGKINRQNPISLNSFPGREVFFEAKVTGRSMSGHARVYLVGKKALAQMWIGPYNNEPTTDTNRFFSSFKITESPVASKGPGIAGLNVPRSPDGPAAPTPFPSGPGSPGFPSNPISGGPPTIPGGPPSIPGGPSFPGSPGTASGPGGPGIPGIPSIPGGPAVPMGPNIPGGPSFPGTPGIPGGPGIPSAPGIPTPPGMPGGPGFPGGPGVPGVPGGFGPGGIGGPGVPGGAPGVMPGRGGPRGPRR